MNEINDEIKQTLNLMQTDIYEGALNELQYHLMSLLEIKRNELQQRLVERSWAEPVTHDQAPYKSVNLDGQISDEAKPLTVEELIAGGWWCDRSGGNRSCLRKKNIDYVECLSVDGCYVFYATNCTGDVKQIHHIGNEFYWSE